ncbi:MAG: hypothetical protein IJK61_03640 [Bacteroidetes bacterium]|nr:hypothetical protein [Bacteroidota bacterium]
MNTKDLVVNPMLTNFALGYKNAAYVSEKIFPVTKVSSPYGKVRKWGIEDFRNYTTIRNARGNDNVIDNNNLTNIEYLCQEHTLTTRLDVPLEINIAKSASDGLDLERAAVNQVRNNLLLSREYDELTYAQNGSNYGANNKVTYADDYLNEPDVNPITEILKYMDQLQTSMLGKRPNKIVMNSKIYNVIRNHPKVRAYAVNNTPGDAVPTKSFLEDLLGVNEIILADATYTADGTTFSNVWVNNILLLNTALEFNNGILDPTFGLTIVSKEPVVDEYYDFGGKIKNIRITEEYDFKITMPDAAFLMITPIDPLEY